VSEPESTEEQNVNLPLEVTTKRGEKTLSEIESTTEQSVNLPLEVTVSSASEASPCNSTDCNRPLQKLAYAEEFEGDTESRVAAYSDVTLLDKRDGVVARASK
jgi:hypothetical protein